MTQHRWGTTDGWEAMAGWDRPLQNFFFQASKLCECDGQDDCEKCLGEGEIYLYENLRDPALSLGRMTLAQVAARMNQYLTDYPRELLTALQRDQRLDAGNDITEYPSVGTARVT
jgi:hypothetical protein